MLDVKMILSTGMRLCMLAGICLLLTGLSAWADEDFIHCGAPTSDRATAVAACSRILERVPPPAPDLLALVYYDRAVAAKDKGDVSGARRDLDASIKLKPTASAYFLRGVIAMDAHNAAVALANYDAALAIEPHNIGIMVDKSIVLDGQGELAAAIAVLDAALALEPGNATALNQRANLYGKRGRNADAMRDWKRAASLDDQLAGFFKQNQRVVRVTVPPKAPLPFETAAVRPGSREALVIGNAAYDVGALANPGNDARAIAAVLRKLGFDVSLALDLRHDAFASALAAFAPKAAKADVALVFYAGHGLQVAKDNTGENFLVPVDARLSILADVEREAVPAADVLAAMAGAASRILILDACRDNPFVEHLRGSAMPVPRARGVGRGLAPLTSRNGEAAADMDSGTLVVFSTAANQVAQDDNHGSSNSPFSVALAKYLQWPGLEIKTVIQKVGQDVVNVTGHKQTPFLSSSLIEEVYLAGH